MNTRLTSVLLPAVLLLAAIALALWVVSQLTGGQAAAERLPPIMVGVSEPGEAPGSAPGVDVNPGVPASDPSTTDTLLGAQAGSAGPGTASTTTRTTAQTPGTTTTVAVTSPRTTHSSVMPASPGGTTPTSTARTVVADPVREHAWDHDEQSVPDGMTSGTSGTMGH